MGEEERETCRNLCPPWNQDCCVLRPLEIAESTIEPETQIPLHFLFQTCPARSSSPSLSPLYSSLEPSWSSFTGHSSGQPSLDLL